MNVDSSSCHAPQSCAMTCHGVSDREFASVWIQSSLLRFPKCLRPWSGGAADVMLAGAAFCTHHTGHRATPTLWTSVFLGILLRVARHGRPIATTTRRWQFQHKTPHLRHCVRPRAMCRRAKAGHWSPGRRNILRRPSPSSTATSAHVATRAPSRCPTRNMRRPGGGTLGAWLEGSLVSARGTRWHATPASENKTRSDRKLSGEPKTLMANIAGPCAMPLSSACSEGTGVGAWPPHSTSAHLHLLSLNSNPTKRAATLMSRVELD